MAPEVWNNQPYDSGSDIWSLGCTIYELAALRPPFLGNSFPLLKKAVLAGRYPSMPRQYSADFVKVIGKLIRVNPKDRPSAAQLLEMPEVATRRQSDWFNKLPSHEVVGDVAFVNTIQVPRNLNQLNFPQPCYPDARPHSPEAWPATDRSRPAAIEQKKQGNLKPISHQASVASENSASENSVPSSHSSVNSVKQSAAMPMASKLIPQPPTQARRPLGTRQPSNAVMLFSSLLPITVFFFFLLTFSSRHS
jgi:serine/threonine protein kinase